MGTTTPQVADAFFARTRTPEQLDAVQAERFDTEVEAVMREQSGVVRKLRERDARIAEREQAHGQAIALQREWMRIITERYHAVTRVTVDEEAFGLLPTRQSETIGTVKDPEVIRANHRAATVFFRRVNGRDLTREHDGYLRWRTGQHRSVPTMLRWHTSPVDPLTPEEAATVGRKTLRIQREEKARAAEQARHTEATRLYVKGDVRPAGMTLERAIAIAHAAQDATDNDTAPTYE